MTDEELTAFLRDLPFLRAAKAADRIEALTAERDEAWRRAGHAEEQWGRCEVKLAKAVELAKEAIETMASTTRQAGRDLGFRC
jgi:Zn-dependent M32 family carboxypeptidase